MKEMKANQFIIILLAALTLWACEGNLEIEKLDNVAHPGYPDYNFSYRFLDGDSVVVKNDTITKGKKAFIELYVNQLDFSKSSISYTFGFLLPSNIDASVTYNGTEYRMGDKISIPYADFKEKVVRLNYFPISSGTYTIALTAVDEGNNERSFSKKITVK